MISKHTVINFMLFMLLWPVAVMGAVSGHWLPTVFVWALLFSHSVLAKKSPEQTMVLSLFALIFGWSFEFLMSSLGLLKHSSHLSVLGVPVWILCLWHGLGLTIRLSNRWLMAAGLVPVLCWLCLVPVTYMTAAKWGAVDVVQPVMASILIIVCWGVMVVMMRQLYSRIALQGTGKELAS